MKRKTLQAEEFIFFSAREWQVGFDAKDAPDKAADEAALPSLAEQETFIKLSAHSMFI